MTDEREEEQQSRGEAAGTDSRSGAGSGADRRRPQPHADCSAAVSTHSHRPPATSALQSRPSSAVDVTHVDCTDGDDELSESPTAVAAANSREGGGCSGVSAGAASPSPLQPQLTSKASYRAQHQLSMNDARSDRSDDANGAGDPAVSQSVTRRRRSSSRSRRRSRSRSTRRRVFANSAFPVDSPDSDDSGSSDELQWSASMRLLRGRSQLCDLLAGGRCRSLRGLLIRTAMRPSEIQGEAQLETAVACSR